MSTAMRKKEEGVYESQPEKKIQIEILIFVAQMQIGITTLKGKVRYFRTEFQSYNVVEFFLP